MNTTLRHLLASAACAVLGFAALHAQTDVHSDNAAGCGFAVFNDGGEARALANTAQQNPALYQRMIERAKQGPNRSMLRVADDIVNTFVIRNRQTDQYDEVTATLVYQGSRARIWVDNKDKANISQTTINSLARGLDSLTPTKSRDAQLSIILNDEAVFGRPAPNRFDLSNPDVEDFLLTDIKDNLIGAFVAGFFSPWDQTDNPGSNRMNILYIDSHEGLQGGVPSILNTMAHEYQHLIHYNTNSQSEIVFNEGCSEVASILNGYQNRSNNGFLSNTNWPMFGWNSNDGTKVLVDYERAMTLMHYFTEQCGERFLTAFNETKTTGMDRVAGALKAIGDNRDWRDLFSSWVAANYMGNFNQPYGYKDRLSNSVPNAFASFTNTSFPDTGSVSLQQYGSAYAVYTKPGPVRVTFHANQPMRVMAMLYRGGKWVECWQLESNTEYVIGSYATYDKVVFGFANLSFNGQTVRWDINGVALGVDNESHAANGLSLAEIRPNPATGPVTLRFTTPVAGDATVQLFDTRGTLVRTIASGEHFDAGDHELSINTSDIPSGAYLVRLIQNGRGVSRSLMVVR
ncbi:MAG TPA: T9SS type A sorting domain-containing protein [Candidatus Kapabacteria bacterium]|nr:T9SS type A sorting domain-containing protein [Candidatus Kapabacteria bacterium]